MTQINSHYLRACLHARQGAVSVNVELLAGGKEVHVTIRQELAQAKPGMLLDLVGALRDYVQPVRELYVQVVQRVDSTQSAAGKFVGLWIHPRYPLKIAGLIYDRQVVLQPGQVWTDVMMGSREYEGNLEQAAGNRQFNITGSVEVEHVVTGCPFRIPYVAAS